VVVAEKSLQTVSLSLKKGQSEAYKEKRQAACDATTVNYKVNGDGTVTDKATGLMWKQCSEGLSGRSCDNGKAEVLTWDGAMQRAKRLSFAGYNDWRLPSKDELLSLVHKACGSPTINSQVFPNTKQDDYWSVTPSVGHRNGAMYVGFDYGDDGGRFKDNSKYVRLVRGGQ